MEGHGGDRFCGKRGRRVRFIGGNWTVLSHLSPLFVTRDHFANKQICFLPCPCKSLEHLFLYCPFVRACWFGNLLGVFFFCGHAIYLGVRTQRWYELLLEYSVKDMFLDKKHFLRLGVNYFHLPFYILDSLWFVHNQGKRQSPKQYYGSWLDDSIFSFSDSEYYQTVWFQI